jgi:hypothetical protein
MSPDSWTFLGTTVLTLGGVVSVYIQGRKQHSENRQVNARLEEKIDPVSNGFAKSVRESLARIELQNELDLRDRTGLTKKVKALEVKVDAHISEHRRAA